MEIKWQIPSPALRRPPLRRSVFKDLAGEGRILNDFHPTTTRNGETLSMRLTVMGRSALEASLLEEASSRESISVTY